MKQPLLGLTLTELQAVVKNLGMPGFAAKQIASWLYDKKAASIDEMTNLSLKHRELLKEIYEVGGEAPVDAMRSADGTEDLCLQRMFQQMGEAAFRQSDALLNLLSQSIQ